TQWSTLARLTLRMDLYSDHRQLANLVATTAAAAANDAAADTEPDPLQLLEAWTDRHKVALDRYRKTMVDLRTTSSDVGVLLVAVREVRNLIARTTEAAD
ncbi:MAG: NAD-glutamate dehydrogenase, partial [Acidimicrobiia bacterium]|nr:NAD-glutamate dehydrogenase [Acidimicrobiia bacterium]